MVWGDNSLGQCNVPAPPSGLVYVEVAAGALHNLARRNDGSVVGWGWDYYGQSSSPDIPRGLACAEIAAGQAFSVALLEAAPACGSVSRYCWPVGPSSPSSVLAVLQPEGCPSLTANDLVLTVSGLPPGGPGLFYYGSQQTQLPFGLGWACVAGEVQRVMPLLIADPGGAVVFPVDLSSFPFAGSSHVIVPGSTWNFQYGFRAPAGGPTTFGFSDALHVVFAP